MKKIDVQAIRQKFGNDIDAFRTLFREAYSAVATGAGRSVLAEQTLLSAVVRWERFISDLFVAYVNRDPSQASSVIQNALLQSATEKYGDSMQAMLVVKPPKHLTRAQAAEVLDPRGRNVTFADGEKLVAGAKRWLSAAYRKGFEALEAKDVAAITAWLKIRNYIAHRSTIAYHEMNHSLTDNVLRGGYPALARSQYEVWNAGSYLKATPPQGGACRLCQYLDLMKGIGTKVSANWEDTASA